MQGIGNYEVRGEMCHLRKHSTMTKIEFTLCCVQDNPNTNPWTDLSNNICDKKGV